MSKYQWQGEPVKVVFGNCMVKADKDMPLWWYNFECYPDGIACIPAIKITTKHGGEFILANHFGIGVHKLLNGGWPNYTHFSLDGKFSTKPQLRLVEFDEEGYADHEARRDKWQQENYPEEYSKMKALKDIATKRFVAR